MAAESEVWQQEWLKTIALMAAVLEAGDRASTGVSQAPWDLIADPKLYVDRARTLFAATDDAEAGS